MLQLVFKVRFHARRAEKPRIKDMMHTSILELGGLEIKNAIKLAVGIQRALHEVVRGTGSCEVSDRCCSSDSERAQLVLTA